MSALFSAAGALALAAAVGVAGPASATDREYVSPAAAGSVAGTIHESGTVTQVSGQPGSYNFTLKLADGRNSSWSTDLHTTFCGNPYTGASVYVEGRAKGELAKIAESVWVQGCDDNPPLAG